MSTLAVGVFLVDAGPVIELPSGHSQIQLVDDGVATANLLVLPPPVSGQLLSVTNMDADATSGHVSVAPGRTMSLTGTSDSWVALSSDHMHNGTVTDVRQLTASADLDIGDHGLAAGVLEATRDVRFHNLVGTDDIASSAITADEMAPGAVGAVAIADSAVTGTKLANASVARRHIADGAVDATKLGDGAVTSAKLLDVAVTTSKLGDAAVTSAKVASHTLTAANMANDTLTSMQIAPNAITSSELAANSVDSSALATGSVTSAKIVDATIVGADIASTTVAAGNMVADTLTAAQIASDAITAAELADDAVDSAAIADGAIVGADVSSSASLSVGSVSASGDVATTGGYLRTTVDSAATAPLTCTAGDIVVASVDAALCFCVSTDTWRCSGSNLW